MNNNKPFRLIRLNSRVKELMHITMDNKAELVPIMHQLSRYRDCEKFLIWLIKNKLTGHNLLEWLKLEHSNSVLGMVKFIVKRHNKDKEERAIILNKDWA